MTYQSEIIKKQTAVEMVNAYEQACAMIEEGYTSLANAEKILQSAFGEYVYATPSDTRGLYLRDPQRIIKETKGAILKSAWRRIIELIELRKVASIKRYEEIQGRIERGELPELSVISIYEILQAFSQNAQEIHAELVKEAFEILRPENGPGWRKTYKTNPRFEIGKKVILTWLVEHRSYRSGFEVKYYSHDKVMAIDKVFHLLDGKGIPDGYNGPLIDAINATDNGGYGETEYFKFRACHNGNLHLEFKRPELVRSLNAIAGGNNLKG